MSSIQENGPGQNIVIQQFLENVLSSSSSDEDELIVQLSTQVARKARSKIARCKEYYEKTIPKMSDACFKSHFRLERSTVELLVQKIGQQISSGSALAIHVPAEKQVLVMLWTLATPDSYRSVSDRFDVSKSTVHSILRRTVEAIFELSPQVIVWPTGTRAVECEAGFRSKAQFPGVVGAVDGTHVQIPAPPEHAVSYINRKSFHSIQLQAVCDHKLRYTSAFAGYPGSVHDARVFRKSPLYEQMDDGTAPFSGDTHLLGDAAYPLMKRLLTPYRDTGHLTHCQMRYNTKHSVTRSTIERSFGQLKGRFRRLKYFPSSDLEFIVKAIIVCCVLHNFCIENNDVFIEESEDGSADSGAINQGAPVELRSTDGFQKRDRIAASF